MISLADLAAIRDKMKDKVVIREGSAQTRVVVGMATCGIAAGARPVLNAFSAGVQAEGLVDKVTVTQTGLLCSVLWQLQCSRNTHTHDKEMFPACI